MRIIYLIALISCFLLFPVLSNAQDSRDIYRIEARQCSDGNDKVQTGFVTQKYDGLLTALHGVVGCKIIKARSSTVLPDNLKVSRVDIKRDIALLVSIEDGSSPSPNSTIDIGTPEPSSEAFVWGFPQGISLHELDLKIPRSDHLRPLKDFISSVDQLSLLEKRASPDVQTDVLSVNGNVMPGHSGAPIFSNGSIIGIASGGLGEGQFGIGWAAVSSNLELVGADSVQERLSKLSTSQAKIGFNYIEPTEIKSSNVTERTASLALLSPALYKIWIEKPDQVNSSKVINPKIRRTVADIENDLGLVVNLDGDQKLIRNIVGDVDYQYYRNWEGTRYAVWLQGRYNGRDVPISNIAYYVMSDNGRSFKYGGPYDDAGDFSTELTLRSRYPGGLNYVSLNYNWSNGAVVIGGAVSDSLSNLRLVLGGNLQNDVIVSPIPKNPFKPNTNIQKDSKNWFAYIAEETEVGLVPVSNIVIKP